MTEKQIIKKSNFVLPLVSFVAGMLSLFIFQAVFVSHDEVMNDQVLLNIEEKLNRLEDKYEFQKTRSLTAQDTQSNIQQNAQPSSVGGVDINEDTLETLSNTLSRKITDEQDAKVESEKRQQEQIQRASNNDRSYQDELLKTSVFAAIQEDAPQRMTNIKEVMGSEEMHSMTSEGRESVVKELVRMANAGEIDMNTFFAN